MAKRGGHLYRRGNVYWMKYYVDGRPVYESTGMRKESQAFRVLHERLGRIAVGQPVLRRVDRIPYTEAAQDLRAYYTSSGERNPTEAEFRLAHLDRFCRHHRLAAIGPADVTGYTLQRQGEKASNGTVNRELAVLGRMLKLAYENGKLLRLPVIRKLKENAPRAGFFERERYDGCGVGSRRISRQPSRSPTPTAGGCRARFWPLSGAMRTSAPARSASIQDLLRMTRDGSCTSRRS